MMTPRGRLTLLATTAGVLAIVLLLFMTQSELPRQRPEDLHGAAVWLNEHPADWIAASVISDAALDSPLPRRFALWRASYQLASRLAPRRHNGSAAFVRAGLFHWYELPGPDRRAVLAAAVPLLRDPTLFPAMHASLFELTHDIGMLRRANPGTRSALLLLRDLAAKNGRFDDYRAIREELRIRALAEFNERRTAGSYGELLMMLPDPITVADEPLVAALLAELRRRPIETMPDASRTRALIEFAIRHKLPLEGLRPFMRMPEVPDSLRARLALHLGEEELASQLELAGWMPASAPWTDYQVDRALYEARRGDAGSTQVHLDRAASSGLTPPVVAALHEAERILDAPFTAEPARLTAIEGGEIGGFVAWRQEVCAPAPTTLPLIVSTVQSDQIPPYIEMYVDDVLVAEGGVAGQRQLALALGSAGLHHLELRIANPVTRGRVQRRVRISA
ncbi:MAG: hypothetical protein QOH21_1084 [Acidobacteriota bacterium]|jgi:hypothetical protein|nr:hypothetical protein [Acidobacteriota bacterium]